MSHIEHLILLHELVRPMSFPSFIISVYKLNLTLRPILVSQFVNDILTTSRHTVLTQKDTRFSDYLFLCVASIDFFFWVNHLDSFAKNTYILHNEDSVTYNHLLIPGTWYGFAEIVISARW